MCFLGEINLIFSREYLKAAVLVSLLSVWVLVGLFYYLNLYTRRRYFTIWTAAWLFYALWITLSFGMERPEPWLLMLELWCIGVSAVFLFWGSQRFLGERVRQTLIGFFLVFLLVWSYVGAYHLQDSLQIEVPLFTLIGLAGLMTARSFLKYRRRHGYIGATLLSAGFLLWSVYMVSYPFLEHSKDLVSLALFISAMIQLLVAVSMIILVLEEFRSSHQLAVEQIQLRKQERDVLKEKVVSSEERYRTLFDQAGEAIIITNIDDFRILELNRAAERLLDIPRAEAGRQALTSFFELSRATTPANADQWLEFFRQQPSLNITRKDGSIVPVEISGARTDYGGNPCCQFFVRELTERARLEQQLRQAEKLSALGQMISGVAHELNNPLAVVKGYLELILAHHDLPRQTRIDLEKVAHEGERAAKLVRNFLSFAREQPTYREMVKLNDLVQHVAELRQFDFTQADIDLRIELDPDLPATSADPDQVQQVLTNLITNSLQAMSQLHGVGVLKVSTRRKDSMIEMSVEDNGPGVPPENVEKIFEPFFTTKEVGTGTGLGLSIAHSIMTEHKGRIYYETSSMGGAGFFLSFPVTDRTTSSPKDQTPTAQPAAQTPAGRAARVLVVDDEKALAEMLGELLKILGHEPSLCHSAIHALELLGKSNFDLIISDFRMPGLNGQQFFEQIRQKHPALADRIIFVTGDVVNQETQSFLRVTGVPNLGKPFNLSSVKSVVAELLEMDAVQEPVAK
jgi:PAS domain S-box-containing protein